MRRDEDFRGRVDLKNGGVEVLRPKAWSHKSANADAAGLIEKRFLDDAEH